MKKLAIVFFVIVAVNASAELVPASYTDLASTVSLAWTNAAGADGAEIRIGIASGQYKFTRDAGTNQEITITGLPGGFTWYFVAEDYYISYVLAGTNNVKREHDSGPSNEVNWQAPCPLNEPQSPVITNGVWTIACQASTTNATLQAIADLTKTNWAMIGPVPMDAPVINHGPVTGSQYFRIKVQ
jgi:hypothetical protein